MAADENCELLIVGGGFTGLWAAIQAKERKPDADIILIEQTFVGDGASGRCGGFLNSNLAHGETNVAHRFSDEADRLQELGTQNMQELLETLERYNIDARYEKTGAMSVALSDFSNMFHYFRMTKDNRITYGGGGAVRYYFNRGIDEKFADVPDLYEQLAKEFLPPSHNSTT